MFDIKEKVALITGGASGIGLCYGKELLRHGLKALSIADVNQEFAKDAIKQIESEFSKDKVLFIQTDVTDKNSVEGAFQKTISKFEHLDILINNAGIMNDAMWEKEIAINLNGTIYGIILAMENYISKYKQGSEGVIINVASIVGLEGFPAVPVYSGTKFAIVGLTKSFGAEVHYNRTKVKVLAICPGVTITPLITESSGKNLGSDFQALFDNDCHTLPSQKPECVAKALIKILENGETGSVWVAEGGKDPYEYHLTPRQNFALIQ